MKLTQKLCKRYSLEKVTLRQRKRRVRKLVFCNKQFILSSLSTRTPRLKCASNRSAFPAANKPTNFWSSAPLIRSATVAHSVQWLGYRLEDRGSIFLLATAMSRPVLGPTSPPIQEVPGFGSPEREADHSPAPSAEVNAWSYTSIPPIRLRGMALS